MASSTHYGNMLPTGRSPAKSCWITTDLHRKAHQYFTRGLATNTTRAYAAGRERFKSFCQALQLPAVPTTESTLLLFITHLATTNIAHTTIKVYLSAIRHVHVSAGLHVHFGHQLTPRLQLTLKGIQKSQIASHPPKVRLPITLQIMQDIKHYLAQQPQSHDNILLWAACCLAFFGFLRVSEFTVPGDNLYDHDCHLSLEDIAIDNRDNPQVIQVRLKQSKTDPFRKGVNIFLGATGNAICPVKGLLPYLALRRPNTKGPLFVLSNGHSLTRSRFSTLLKNLLSSIHLNTGNYNTHSFRIGAATSAKQANIPDTLIKMLGRWKSDAYQTYIKTPAQDLAKLSKCMTSSFP